MANKTNKSNNANSIKLTNNNPYDKSTQLGEPLSPRIMKESQNLSPKMLNTASAKQQNTQSKNTTSTSSSFLQSIIDKITSRHKGK